jgi:hypothetical protein
MNTVGQRAGALLGFINPVLYIVGFIILARFQIPPSPMSSADEIVLRLAENRNGIRAGLIICMFSAALLIPWSVVVALQLKRGEGGHAPMATSAMVLSPAASVCIVYPLMFWQTAAYREDRPAVLVQMLNDMAWLPWVAVTSYACVSALVMGLSILSDRSDTPVFPRWAAYLKFFVTLELATGSLCVFFKSGEFAWNGILSWYLPVAFSGVWFTTMTILCLRAISAEAVAGGATRPSAEPATV